MNNFILNQNLLENLDYIIPSHNHDLDSDSKDFDLFDRAEQPIDLNINLYPHQLVSIYNMEKLELTRKIKIDDNNMLLSNFGILSDMAGSGKSYTILGLILRDKMQWDISSNSQKCDIISSDFASKINTEIIVKKRIKGNIILVSPNVIEQWSEYFCKINPQNYRIFILSSNDDLKKFKNPEIYDIILVNQTKYNSFIENHGKDFIWKRFIFDDPYSCSIPNMAEIHSNFTWFIMNNPNDLLKIKSKGYMFTFTSSIKKFGDNFNINNFAIKNNENFINLSFKQPQILKFSYKCHNPFVLKVIGSFINKEVKELISANDYRSAILKLGGNIFSNENIIELVIHKHNEQLSNLEKSLNDFVLNGNNVVNNNELKSLETKLTECKKNIDELNTKYKEILNSDCSICYSSLEDPIFVSCCQNIFCGKCITTWIQSKQSCPLCRGSLDPSKLSYVFKKGDKEAEIIQSKHKPKKIIKEEKLPTKEEKIISIIFGPGTNNKKFILYSDYDTTFINLLNFFMENGIMWVEIKGNKSQREANIQKYKSGFINIIIFNGRYDCSGINLPETTDIIFYNDQSVETKKKCISRAVRIGRDIPLVVHELHY